MASILPFDNATIAGTPLAASDFVHGSGSLQEKGSDKAVTTADGRIHNHREAVNRDGSCEAHGDKTSLNSARGVGVAIVLKNGVDTIASFPGIVTASYSESSKTTSISITGDPE